MTTSDLQSEDNAIFENVEFVEPTKQTIEQPSYPFRQQHKAANRKRKEHPLQTTNDEEFTIPPPSKRAKIQHQSSKWSKYQQPTIQEIENHLLFKLAKQHWIKSDNEITFDASLVSRLYFEHIAAHNSESQHSIMILEFSQYLEKYLWRFFDFKISSDEHILSIVYFINKKFEQRGAVWSVLMDDKNDDKLTLFFDRIFAMKLDEMDVYLDGNKSVHSVRIWSKSEKAHFLLFLMNCFYKMEHESVGVQILKLVGLPLFQYLDDKEREKIFAFVPSLAKLWRKYTKNKCKIPRHQKELYWMLFGEFFMILAETESLYKVLHDMNDKNESLHMEYSANMNYIYTFCQLLLDNLCILMTRRYLRPLMESSHILFLIQCQYLVSPLLFNGDALFHTLMDKIAFYLHFEVDDFDGRSLNDNEMRLESNHKLMVLQKCAFKHFYDCTKAMALCTISDLDNCDKLAHYLKVLSIDDLYSLCDKLHILPAHRAKDIQLLLKSNDSSMTQRDVLIEIFIAHHVSRKSKREQIANLPLYPTERILFDDDALFLKEQYEDEDAPKYNVLGLDKLNLQFLSIYDYLLRNYNLYRLECAHSIRDDIAKAIWKIRPRLKRNLKTKMKETVFTGYSRYAVAIDEFSIASVHKPFLGETKPSKVAAEIAVDLRAFHDDIWSEWEDLRSNDVLFVVRLKGVYGIDVHDINNGIGANECGVGNKRWDELSMKELGIEYVRGCHIVCVRDGDDAEQHVINEYDLETGQQYKAKGTKRIYDVLLDCAQYQLDIEAMVENEATGDVYSYFNLLIRRKGKENNFKSILSCITSLMAHSNNINVYHDRSSAAGTGAVSDESLLPKWFSALFLGYGSPQSAAYYNIHPRIAPPSIVRDNDEGMYSQDMMDNYYCLDFGYCFVDFEHIQTSFIASNVTLLRNDHDTAVPVAPPFKIWFNKNNMNKPNYEQILNASLNKDMAAPLPLDIDDDDIIYVEPYYDVKQDDIMHVNLMKRNTMRYNPIQIEAIKSGMLYGLTMVVGPPGTGKTDVAVQIISNLYANFGETERILLVTHSNMALNDLFSKIVEREHIDRRHLLRLGYGSKTLQEMNKDNLDFSKNGRIDYMLNERLDKLQIVQFLAQTLGVSENSGYCHTAETCAHFKTIKLMPLWQEFEDKLDEFEDEKININRMNELQVIDTLFPFKTFIQEILCTISSEESVFLKNSSYSLNKCLAYKYWSYILNLFADIKQCHVFELLRSNKDRTQYLLCRQSKIVAMTVTHAAIKRDELMKYKFEYDTLIMEESAQILDIETFIPMVLQRNRKRLKRIILIGDHHQLPPIIKNRCFAAYSKLDESLFHRLIRLGTPYHLLNLQGRCRPSIRCLWSWNYPYRCLMGDLPCVLQQEEYKLANAGFYYDFQLINVDNFLGNGEFQPTPYFYQNLDEAEYIVNCFMFMRLIGYPANKITILTTYNGQKHLIREIINKKCINDPLFGAPRKISTVDKYQGSQNDYILLSLVRTRCVGYLRDIRRLIVALSRSKYGLYIFANANLFKQCYELKQSFDLLLKRPTQLTLVTNESFPTQRAMNATLNESQYDENNGKNESKHFEIENISHFMHVVNRMSGAVRNHFKSEYQEKLDEYKERARIALQSKKEREREREREREGERERQRQEEKKDEEKAKEIETETETETRKGNKKGLNTKEQFDLAAEMALMRSHQIINDDDDGGGGYDDNEQQTNVVNDQSIEYESSSSQDE